AVSGGVTLTLPAATSYTQNTGSWNSNRTLQASGAGSVLALPNLTTITGSTQYGSNLYVQALAGGHVNLGAATAVTGGAVNLTADGTNSVLDLSALQSFQGYFINFQIYTSTSNIQATNGGSILDPRLATVNTAGLTLDGTGTIGTASITALTNSTVTVSGTGTAADFSGVTDLSSTSLTLSGGGTANLDHAAKIDGDNIAVSGGVTLTLPAATSYTQNTGSWNSNRTLQASGAGSVLALPNLTTITGSTQYGSNLYVQALAGGHVNLTAATAVTGGAVNLTADGSNSVLDLAALQSFQGYLLNFQIYTSTSNFRATNGGTIVLNSGTLTLMGADVSAASTGTIVGGTLQLSGGTLSGNSTIQASVFNSAATSP